MTAVLREAQLLRRVVASSGKGNGKEKQKRRRESSGDEGRDGQGSQPDQEPGHYIVEKKTAFWVLA